MLLTFLILFFSNVGAQKDTVFIDVYTSNKNSKVRAFEISLLNEIIGLYNSNNKIKIKPRYVFNKSYSFIINEVTRNTVDPMTLGIAGLTISKSKRVDFLHPTLPIHTAIIKKKNPSFVFDPKKKYRLTHLDTKIYTKMAVSLTKKLNLTLVPKAFYKEMVQAVLDEEVDFYLGDSLDGWLNPKTDILFNVHNQPKHLGYIVPNGSKLKTMLDPFISYYIHTSSFYNLLRKHFGQEFSEYYRKTVQQS